MHSLAFFMIKIQVHLSVTGYSTFHREDKHQKQKQKRKWMQENIKKKQSQKNESKTTNRNRSKNENKKQKQKRKQKLKQQSVYPDKQIRFTYKKNFNVNFRKIFEKFRISLQGVLMYGWVDSCP